MFPYEYEWDWIWMSLVIFVPTVFALGLLFFPRGTEKRHALVVADRHGAHARPQHRHVLELPATTPSSSHGVLDTAQARYDASLPGRAAAADNPNLGAPAKSRDWIARYPWIKSFNIDYYLGVDGISMALVLLDHGPVLPGHDRQLEDRQVRPRLSASCFCCWKPACWARSWRSTSSCSTSSGK